MPKKDPKKPAAKLPKEMGRVELQAPVEWIAKLDAAAAALGLGRSAYVRMACNRLMAADAKQQ